MNGLRFYAVLFWTALFLGIASMTADAKTLEVGEGRTFERIENAYAASRPGDSILVHPLENNRPYEMTAVFVEKQNLTFRAVPGKGESRVKISGKGFDFSGVGSTPRAIFQFNRGADGCTLEGFDLSGAHNASHNGAGVRINQANRITVRSCSIHDNDMGAMSNGDGTANTADAQIIEYCEIHDNGDPGEPGQNHNLYLGGASVTLSFCEIHSSLTGHNLKSRAHHTCVQYCFLHDSANRELDLVDADDTTRPESHALLLGNIIVKDPKCKGNRSVIHFGQDGGKGHDGTLCLYFNTMVTPFIAPVVELSAPQAKAELVGNLLTSGEKQNNQQVASIRGGALVQNLTGRQNWFAGDFSLPKDAGMKPQENRFGLMKSALFANPAKNDYHFTKQGAREAKTMLRREQLEDLRATRFPAAETFAPLTWQYRHPAGKEKRTNEKELNYGAFGSQSNSNISHL